MLEDTLPFCATAVYNETQYVDSSEDELDPASIATSRVKTTMRTSFLQKSRAIIMETNGFIFTSTVIANNYFNNNNFLQNSNVSIKNRNNFNALL